MSPEEAIQHALDGNAILFTGAGFSWGAKNIILDPEDEWIPSGKALAKLLLTKIGYPASALPLDKAASAYLRRNNSESLVNLLVPLFTVREVTDSHRVIAALPFRRAYTTNYDSVYEQARNDRHLVSNSVEGQDDPRLHLHKAGLIVHINGSITKIDNEKLGGAFKLASDSYASESFENSGWAFQFRNDVRAAKAIIFIGYSMYDLDIRRVIFNEDISDRCVFINAPLTPDNELDAEDLIDLGVMAPIGVDAFASMVRAIQDEYVPQELELTLEVWDEILSPESVVAAPTDEEVLNFLTSGDLSSSILNEALGQERALYTIVRSAYDNSVVDLKQEISPVTVIGDLGSGKSTLCEVMARDFGRSGFRVFRLDHASENSVSELQEICTQGGPKLLIVENYQRHMDVLRWLSVTSPENVLLIITARTSSHDLFQKEVLQLFPRLRLYDLSVFDAQETSGAVALLDTYGLWGEKASFAPVRKIRFINEECAGALSSLLVDVLKSKHIRERYSQLLAEANNRADVEAFLVCAFSLEVMGFSPTIPHIQELLANSVDWGVLRAQSELKSVIRFGSNRVRARSSVLAKYLLNEVFSARKVVGILIGMVKQADARRADKDYYQILNETMRYGHISVILSDEKRLESTINFYEGIKNLGSTKRNPQFWLQYAIACLALGQLDRSGRYFKSAYSFAAASGGYNTFQIDNHYARWLLESSLLEVDIEDGKRMVDKAVSIVLQQMAEEVKFYPYRVAIGVFKFYDKHKTQFSALNKKSFLKIFVEIRRRANASPAHLQNNKYLIECLRKAESAIAELSA